MPKKGDRRGGAPGCTVCGHAEVARINFLAARGAALAPLARKFGLSDDALWRHYRRHVTDDFKRSVTLGPFRDEAHLRKLCAESGTSVLDNLRSVYSGLASRWLVNYEGGHDDKLALLTARLHQNLELQAKLTKELMPGGPTTLVQNFFQLPIFGELQSTLLRVLAQHPEARAEVIRAFRDLEGRSPKLIEVAAA